MMQILLIIACSLLTEVTSTVYRKVSILALNNGGNILSNTDWINWGVQTPEGISWFCKGDSGTFANSRKWINYNPGTLKSFNTTVPVSKVLILSIQQYNYFFSNDGVTIELEMEAFSKQGYYIIPVSLKHFSSGGKIDFMIDYLPFSISWPSSIKQADYYFIIELLNTPGEKGVIYPDTKTCSQKFITLYVLFALLAFLII